MPFVMMTSWGPVCDKREPLVPVKASFVIEMLRIESSRTNCSVIGSWICSKGALGLKTGGLRTIQVRIWGAVCVSIYCQPSSASRRVMERFRLT